MSEDGKELHLTTDRTYRNGQPYHSDAYFKRIGGGSNEDAFTGVWETEPSKQKLAVPPIYTISDVENGLHVKHSTGLEYTAKFDGEYYPATGVSQGSTASLERIDDRTVRFVLKGKDGTITRTATIAVANGELTETMELVDAKGTRLLKAVAVYDKQ